MTYFVQRGAYYGTIYTVIMLFAMIFKSSNMIGKSRSHLVSAFSPSTSHVKFASSTTLSAITTISFDPSNDIRDKATSTLVIGRQSTLKTLIDKTDSYVSLVS